MELPKITVITPSFNQGEFIEETIFSVISQRYPNLEFILIDGGSTDSTLEVLERYKDHFAYCVSEKDSGQTNAINKGLARATGDIVAILNSDDVYLPGTLDFVAEQFQKDSSLKWMTGPSMYWGDDKAKARAEMLVPNVPTWTGGWLIAQSVPHPSTFVKAELHKKFGPFDESFYFAMDYEYWCRLAFGGETLRPFSRPLSGYRMHGESKSVVAAERRESDKKRILNMYLPQLSEPEQRKVLKGRRSAEAMLILTPILDVLRAGNQAEAAALWKKATEAHPETKWTRWYFTSWVRIKFNIR